MLQTQIEQRPEDLGFDSRRLSRLEPFFDSYLSRKKVSGYGILVARSGKIVHLGMRGQSAFKGGFALESDSIFRIYSMTKPITSVALMMLYEEGLVQLYDPVSKFIPSFSDLRVFAGGTAHDYTTREVEREMTVHDLLTHQSGLTYDFMLMHPVDALYRKARINGLRSEAFDLEEFVDALSKLPLVFSPGERWNYSVSTDVCGRLIEIISGQSLDDFLAGRIFKPLQMDDTFFTIPAEKLSRLTHNYMRDPDSGKINLSDSPTKTIYRPGRRFLSGGGGLLSTMPDYFKFCEMLHRGGFASDGEMLLSPKTLSMMTCNHLPNGETLVDRAHGSFSEMSYGGTGFGLGFGVITDPSQTSVVSSRGNYSWGGAASTYFWIDPEEQLTVIFMTQIMPSGSYPMRSQLQQLVYASLTG